jgi:peptidoglycan/LPS O-acetylase OafA/YrhL
MFIGGMVAFRLLRGTPVKLPSFMWPLGVIALMVARCSLLDGVSIDTTRNATVNAITCLVLGLGIPLFEEVRSRWLSYVAHQIAKYSYGIYLLHVPSLALVFLYLPSLPLPLKIGAFLALTGVASAFTYHLIEHPFIQWGRSIARRIELSRDSKSWHQRLPSNEPRRAIDAFRISS